MDAKRDADIDPAPLSGKRVAIIGYGNQGRPQARNLNDSGTNVIVALRNGSPSAPFTANAIMAIASMTRMAWAARLAKKASPVANARIELP